MSASACMSVSASLCVPARLCARVRVHVRVLLACIACVRGKDGFRSFSKCVRLSVVI